MTETMRRFKAHLDREERGAVASGRSEQHPHPDLRLGRDQVVRHSRLAEGAGLTFGEVVLLPGQGHDRHNHPEAEEILYVLSGEGEQMLDDGEARWFPVTPGDTIYVPTGASTRR